LPAGASDALWIPDGVAQVRGILVDQHGRGRSKLSKRIGSPILLW